MYPHAQQRFYGPSPSPDTLAEASRTTAAHLARLQELIRPSEQAAAQVLGNIAAASSLAFGDPDIPSAAHQHIPAMAEAYRWAALGKPHEPTPPALIAYASREGYTTTDWEPGVDVDPGHLHAAARTNQKIIEQDLLGSKPEILTTVEQVIEASPGYHLCESLIMFPSQVDAPKRTKDFEQAAARQRILRESGYDTVSQAKMVPGEGGQPEITFAYHNAGVQRILSRERTLIEIRDDPAVPARSRNDQSLAHAKSHFFSLISDEYSRNYPNLTISSHILNGRSNILLSMLIEKVVKRLNGSDSPLVANDFMETVMFKTLVTGAESFIQIVSGEKTTSAARLYAALIQLPTALSSGNEYRWWLKGLPKPPPFAGAQSEARVTKPQKPLTKAERDQLDATILGEILIDERPSSVVNSRRLIVPVLRDKLIPPPSPESKPYLRLLFDPEGAKDYREHMPIIPGFITCAELKLDDGSRMFDFVPDTKYQDPYSFCKEPLTTYQSEQIIGFYRDIGATQMVKNLEASRGLRVGDIPELLGRSSAWHLPREGYEDEAWWIENGYIATQCVGGAELTSDGLKAGLTSVEIRTINGRVLPAKGEKLTASGHRSVEYINHTGRTYILDPPLYDRDATLPDAELSAEDAEVVSTMVIAHTLVATGVARVTSKANEKIKAMRDAHTLRTRLTEVDKKLAESKPSSVPTITEEEPVASMPAEEQVQISSFERVKLKFEEVIRESFNLLGTPNHPLQSVKVQTYLRNHCGAPGNIIGMAARLVNESQHAQDMTAGDITAQLAEIDHASQFVKALANDPTLRRRTGGYGPAIDHKLTHILSTLATAYQRELNGR